MSERHSGFTRDPHDFYTEQRFAVELLADAERFDGTIWDPACGNGTIPRVFDDRGHGVLATDIVNRYPRNRLQHFVMDFLTGPALAGEWDNIICNPPYRTLPGTRVSMAGAFARRALGLARRKVALLVQLKFLAGQGRFDLFTGIAPRKVWILSERPSMPPGELVDPFTGLMADGKEPAGGSMDFAWVVWDRAHEGETAVGWLKRERSRRGANDQQLAAGAPGSVELPDAPCGLDAGLGVGRAPGATDECRAEGQPVQNEESHADPALHGLEPTPNEVI